MLVLTNVSTLRAAVGQPKQRWLTVRATKSPGKERFFTYIRSRGRDKTQHGARFKNIHKRIGENTTIDVLNDSLAYSPRTRRSFTAAEHRPTRRAHDSNGGLAAVSTPATCSHDGKLTSQLIQGQLALLNPAISSYPLWVQHFIAFRWEAFC